LLLAWDKIIKDKTLSIEEVFEALQAYRRQGALSDNEMEFVLRCFEDYNGDINKMCPPSMPTSFYIFLFVVGVIAMYLLGGKK